eukprot:UN16820
MFRIYKPENRESMFPKENFMQDPRVTFAPVDVKASKTEISTSSSRIVLDHKRLVFYHNGEKVIEEHSYGFLTRIKKSGVLENIMDCIESGTWTKTSVFMAEEGIRIQW